MDKDNSDKKKSRPVFLSWVLAIFFVLVSAALTFVNIEMSKNFRNEIQDVKKIQTEQFEKHTETNQFLLSTVDWSSRRSQLTMFMRDQIIAQWKKNGVKVNQDDAFKIAEANLKECENYSYIDPFLILATQCVESQFLKKIKSPMGAIGLNQFMPATGRLMAGYFNMEYHDSLLYNIGVSTKFAVKLFDVLYAQYHDWGEVLAGYNGGPYQAHYYKSDKQKLAAETKAYVPGVLNKKFEYDTLFVKYRMEEKVKGTILDKLQGNRLAHR